MNIEYLSILREIVIDRKTVVVETVAKTIKRVLYFEKGLMVFCETSLEEERLLNILSSLNFIDKIETDLLKKDLEELQTRNLKIGQKLVSEKIISPSQLYTALKYQAKIIALNIFKEKDIKLNLVENKTIAIKKNKLNISPVEILLEIYENTVINKKIKEIIRGKIKINNFFPSVFETLLTEKEKKFFNELKDGNNMEEIMKKNRFAEKMLFKLYVLGFVKIEKKEEKALLEEEEKGISESFFEEIKEYYELAINKNYSTILKGKGEEKKRNYLKLIKKFHPDRLPPNSEKKIKNMVETIFDAINKAFSIRENEETNEQEEKISDEELALQTYKRAYYLFNNQKYSEVIRLIKNVLSYSQLNAKTILLLAKAEAKIDIYKKDAEKDLMNIIKKEPWMREAYHQLLLLYEEENLTSRAIPIINKALKYFPNDELFLKFSQKLMKRKKKRFFPF